MNLRDFGLAKATFAEVIPYQRRSRPWMAKDFHYAHCAGRHLFNNSSLARLDEPDQHLHILAAIRL